MMEEILAAEGRSSMLPGCSGADGVTQSLPSPGYKGDEMGPGGLGVTWPVSFFPVGRDSCRIY